MKMMINRILSMPLWMTYVKMLPKCHFLRNNLHTLTTGDLKLLLQILMLKKRQRLNWKFRLELVVGVLKKVNMNFTSICMRMSTVSMKLRTYWMECVIIKSLMKCKHVLTTLDKF